MNGSLRRVARLVAVAAMVAGSALGLAPSASAVTVEGSGWWWLPNSTTAPIDVPPRADVGSDQLLAEGTAQGTTAVAAVRFKLSEGESSPVLTITPTQDSVVPPEAIVLACRAASAWEPAQGGKWERRPIADCFTSVQGIPAEGGKLVFAVTPLLSGQDLEVVITPGVNPAAPSDQARGSSFSLKFNKPTTADLQTSSGDESGFSSVGGDFTAPDPGSFGAGADSSSSTDTGSSFDSGSSFSGGGTTFEGAGTSFGPSPAFSQPSTFTPPAAVAPAASASVSAAEQAGPTGVAPPLQAAPVSNEAESSSGRTLGILVLLAGAALAFWAYSGSMGAKGVPVVPVAPPPGTEPVMGGLGRFARSRLGPPPPLS